MKTKITTESGRVRSHKTAVTALCVLLLGACTPTQKTLQVEYIPQFPNANHPQIATWALTPQDLNENRFLSDLDTLAAHGPFDLLMLSAREGMDFYDTEHMAPILEQIVRRAHEKGLKVGLLLGHDLNTPPTAEQAQSVLSERELILDDEGSGEVSDSVAHLCIPERITRCELFHAWAFRKTSDGEYEPGSLVDITARCKVTPADTPPHVRIEVIGSPELKGYTAYVLTRHVTDRYAPHDRTAAGSRIRALRAYRDIPIDGIGLDDHDDLKVIPPSRLGKNQLSERYWSQAMADALKTKYRTDMTETLLDMRYVPEGKPEVRIKAINTYMDVMRGGPLKTEQTVAAEGRRIFGDHIFISHHRVPQEPVHGRFGLAGERVWETGLNEWSFPSSYAYNDGEGPRCLQLGLAMAGGGSLLYNTSTDTDPDRVIREALSGLRYGVRTHFTLDRNVDIDDPDTRAQLSGLGACTRLLNRFSPSLPEVRLLVIFGTEALSNWYPDRDDRGAYDINARLGIEEKVERLWNAGYMCAMVPSDVIVEEKLALNADNQPMMNGHTFDAIVYLYPEYARTEVINFLDKYVSRGGRLMIEGSVSHDFNGEKINSTRWTKIYQMARSVVFTHEEVLPSLGIARRDYDSGTRCEDGSWVFTDRKSLTGGQPATFRFEVGDDLYEGIYHGMAAIGADPQKGLRKLAAHGFRRLCRNGKVMLSLSHPADVFLEIDDRAVRLTLADSTRMVKPYLDNL